MNRKYGMLNNIKLLLLIIVLLVGLTSCKAETNQETAGVEAVETEQTIVETKPGEYVAGEWITDYDKALALAKESKLPVLLNFTGSDWCSWCIRLSKEVFSEKAFAEYAKANLILLKLDFPRNLPQTPEEKQRNETLAKQYGIEGFPTIVILNPDGKEIGRTGYQQGGVEKYIEHLKSLIK